MKLDSLTVRLPWPNKMLFPNARRGHFGVVQPAIVQARADGFNAARAALGRNAFQPVERTAVRLLFVAPDRRNRDWDGLAGAIKHQMDGIARALGVDDRIFRPVTIDSALDAKKVGFVLVDILGAGAQ